ncbi:hypothetical protein RhiirA1_480919 [Rhizophagus irregularis]|uniref:Uncharacterized protein n=1 Tax=Rhizophagus irregularis TaxID=588596 RepID=A0A2N0QNR1_9GLOM|nr:hypothetical protein RhiirA1_480919 [Rhizophagus irregularis]
MAVKHLKHYLNLWVMEIAVFPNSLKHKSLIFIFNYRNSINEHLSKELANKIIELIEDADRYKWNYNHLYTSKNDITYWYFCSQRDIQASKSHKHSDPSK